MAARRRRSVGRSGDRLVALRRARTSDSVATAARRLPDKWNDGAIGTGHGPTETPGRDRSVFCYQALILRWKTVQVKEGTLNLAVDVRPPRGGV